MKCPRWFALLFSIGVTAAAIAQDFEISTREIAPSGAETYGLRVAASASGYLATWLEEGNPYEGYAPLLRAVRIDTNGTPLDVPPLTLGQPQRKDSTGPSLVVGSSNSSFLVIGGSTAYLVRADGTVQAIPTGLEAPSTVVGHAGGWLVFDRTASTINYLRIDSDGRIPGPPVTLIRGPGTMSFGAATEAGRVLLAWSGPSGAVAARSFSLDDLWTASVPAEEVTWPPGQTMRTVQSVTASRHGFAITWEIRNYPSPVAAHVQLVRIDGEPIGEPIVVAEAFSPRSIAVENDGTSYLVVASQGDATSTRTLSYGGVLGDWVPSGGSATFALANSTAGTLFAWKEDRGRSPGAYLWSQLRENVADMTTPATLLSTDYPTQRDVAAAWAGSHYVAAWTEITNVARVRIGRVMLDGTTPDGPGLIAAVGGLDLEPQVSIASDGKGVALFASVGYGAGLVFFDEALRVIRRIDKQVLDRDPTVVWNGSEYVAAWSAYGPFDLMMQRFSPSGIAIDPVPVSVAKGPGRYLRVARNGDGYMLYWGRPQYCAPGCSPALDLMALPLTGTLQPVGAPLMLSPAHVIEPSVASNAPGAVAVFLRYSNACSNASVALSRVSRENVPLDYPEPMHIACVGNVRYQPAIYPHLDGFRLVVGRDAWDSSRDGSVRTLPALLPFVGEQDQAALFTGGPAMLSARKPAEGSRWRSRYLLRVVSESRPRRRATAR